MAVSDVAAPPVGWVHSWDTSVGVDGPGTRVVVFMAGCPLRCIYCENPETWCRRDGVTMSVEEIDALLERFERFIKASGGGLTVSGGEPLQQAEFTKAIMQRAKARGLHTALDTSGFLGRRAGDELLDATDLVLLDIKAGSDEMHHRITGRPLGPTLEFARRLGERGDRTWVRYVLVPGYTDDPDEVDAVARYCVEMGCVERVDILPFHKLGAAKYDSLGIEFPLADHPVPTPECVARVREQFQAHGLVAC